MDIKRTYRVGGRHKTNTNDVVENEKVSHKANKIKIREENCVFVVVVKIKVLPNEDLEFYRCFSSNKGLNKPNRLQTPKVKSLGKVQSCKTTIYLQCRKWPGVI